MTHEESNKLINDLSWDDLRAKAVTYGYPGGGPGVTRAFLRERLKRIDRMENMSHLRRFLFARYTQELKFLCRKGKIDPGDDGCFRLRVRLIFQVIARSRYAVAAPGETAVDAVRLRTTNTESACIEVQQ